MEEAAKEQKGAENVQAPDLDVDADLESRRRALSPPGELPEALRRRISEAARRSVEANQRLDLGTERASTIGQGSYYEEEMMEDLFFMKVTAECITVRCATCGQIRTTSTTRSS